MTQLKWDQAGERKFELGVDHGVLYVPDSNGNYTQSAAWNGLTTVTETPSGAESNKTYADNIAYVNLLSAEDFAITIEALTYPKLFNQCDGLVEVSPGVFVAQQTRKPFGMKYRSKIGTDLNSDAGYKLHLVYGCQAAPSEKAFETLNDSPDPQGLSWDVTTSSVDVPGQKSTALLTVDSTVVDPTALANLLAVLHGTAGTDPRLPLPAEVISLLGTGGAAPTVVRMTSNSANAPAYNSSTHVVTLPATTGVDWYVNGTKTAAGALPALTSGQSSVVTALAQSGYRITGQDRWTFDY